MRHHQNLDPHGDPAAICEHTLAPNLGWCPKKFLALKTPYALSSIRTSCIGA